ncbi:MAG: hypothetical protein WA623_09715, partial [Candidatus Sulfotelmatobacter sp.]
RCFPARIRWRLWEGKLWVLHGILLQEQGEARRDDPDRRRMLFILEAWCPGHRGPLTAGMMKIVVEQ